MAEHHRNVCIEHNETMAQCRCPAPDKAIRMVPCTLMGIHPLHPIIEEELDDSAPLTLDELIEMDNFALTTKPYGSSRDA